MNEMEYSLEILETRALELQGHLTLKQIAKRYDRHCELYPEVKATMTKQRQLTFLLQASRFYRLQNEQTGAEFLREAQELLKRLERKLFRREHKTRFRAKFQRLFPEVLEA